MKREERNALSTQRILDAARHEFAGKGYDGASLNTICAENGISKGIIYHYFKDKDEIYLLCVAECFDALTARLRDAISSLTGTTEERLRGYFDARLHFFTENPLYFAIFTDAVLNPHDGLRARIEACRSEFDATNIAFLTELLSAGNLRDDLTVSSIVEDFKMYTDFFHMRFRKELRDGVSEEIILREHEERIRRQIDILMYGVIKQ